MTSIPELLSHARTIAVVGLSADPARPSHGVARYMQQHGYRIIPVNPTYAGTHILGEHCYPTLTKAAEALADTATAIDIVDCFRRSDSMLPIAEEAVAVSAGCLWMQLGVLNEEAANLARASGMEVVTDRCIKIEHARGAPD
jgi:predicted CoA-binding protein